MVSVGTKDRRTEYPVAPDAGATRQARLFALIAAIVGIVLTVAVPLLPVTMDNSTLSWPQNDTAASVTAPLIEYTPTQFDATIPCSTAGPLSVTGGYLVATAPKGSADGVRYGLVAAVDPATATTPAQLRVLLRNLPLLTTPLDTLTGAGCTINIDSTSDRTTLAVTGAVGVAPATREGDFRPQIVGVFSDLTGAAPAGLNVTAHIDNRFSSTPTTLKLLAMIVGSLATILALVALHRIDISDGRRTRRILPARWWKFGVIDYVVVGTLLVWHIIGANTADDGYQLGMARISERAGYMVNFFRYFGVPETPFGSPYYDVFTLFARVSTASVWVRLPALIFAIAAWLVISREVVPRLGAAAKSSKAAMWTGGLVFLAFWLPYNNGLRPEPAVALGVLLTWCSVERAISTRRLLPAAAAVLIAGFTVTAGPSGLICFAALFAGARPIIEIIVAKGKRFGYLALVAPLIAAGTVILVPVFADQPLATVPVMQNAHEVALPNLPWYQEYLRYQYLLQDTVDGSLDRRFGVFIMVAALVVVIAVILRKGGRIPGLAAGPARRIVGITIGAMMLMMFTPTKWTHHFGVFAGLASSVAVVLAVALGPAVMRSRRNRALVIAGISFLMALAWTSRNGYWYVSSWGVPWNDKAPSISGFGFSTVFRGLTVLALAAAAYFHVREPHLAPTRRALGRLWTVSPVIVAAALMVLLEVSSMAKATVSQYPAYSVGRSNIDAIAGNPCGLANDVLVETDPNASMLTPLNGDVGSSLGAGGSPGFTPNGVAGDLTSDETGAGAGTANLVSTDTNSSASSASTAENNAAGTGGGAGAIGVNASSVALPFGLDPSTTPVLGSYGTNSPASLTSGWYRLPPEESGSRGELISIAAAGRIRSVDKDGIVTYGQNLEVEYGTSAPDGTAVAEGRVAPIDIGPAPSWRNMRVPLSEIPLRSDVIRIVASDNDLDPDQWLAVTPPRVPKTQILGDLVGRSAPVLIDWAVGLNFPCQHLIDVHDGVVEVPQYRILPDRDGAVSTNLWQDHVGGGPLGWINVLLSARTVPSYLKGDLRQDWGELEQYSPYDPNAVPAQLDTSTTQRSGLYSPGPIKTTS